METVTSVNKPQRTNAVMKFVLFSTIGVIVFFVSLFEYNGTKVTPLVFLLSIIKDTFGEYLSVFTLILMVVLCVTTLISTFTDKILFISAYHKGDSNLSKVLYVIGAIFSIMIYSKIGPKWVLHPDVGGLAFSLAGSVFLTVALAGALVTLLSEFGLLEIIGTLMEPLMRPLYKVPGHAAVDGTASFVCAPAVGVFLTNKVYCNKGYTKREAACVATNFSVCSLGFFVLLTDWGGIPHLYTAAVLTSFFIVFIMSPIVIRIPPLSLIPDEFIDGTSQKTPERILFQGIFSRALKKAIDRAESTDVSVLLTGFKESLVFAQKIAAYVVAIATLSLAIATFTPLFQWIGIPIAPILNLFGLPNAAEIAPSVLVGISEIALPVLLIAGKSIAEASVFFIVVLTTVQIIFFTESANAIMESDIPLGIGKLVIIFLIRTAIAIPLVAIATHLLF
ncbi:MAG: nucleoside recognition domain-containing protein [Dehalobacterium sp.]